MVTIRIWFLLATGQSILQRLEKAAGGGLAYPHKKHRVLGK